MKVKSDTRNHRTLTGLPEVNTTITSNHVLWSVRKDRLTETKAYKGRQHDWDTIAYARKRCKNTTVHRPLIRWYAKAIWFWMFLLLLFSFDFDVYNVLLDVIGIFQTPCVCVCVFLTVSFNNAFWSNNMAKYIYIYISISIYIYIDIVTNTYNYIHAYMHTKHMHILYICIYAHIYMHRYTPANPTRFLTSPWPSWPSSIWSCWNTSQPRLAAGWASATDLRWLE